jgi:hypothetical protein
MAKQSRRFSIYDAMEDKGVFEANPANSYARDLEGASAYSGPVKYPMMLYHPSGERRVIVAGQIELINGQYVKVGEQTEVVFEIVHDAATERRLVAEGWHRHPSHAIKASGEVAPVIASPERAEALRKAMAEMQAELEMIEPAQAPSSSTPVASPKASAKPIGPDTSVPKGLV